MIYWINLKTSYHSQVIVDLENYIQKLEKALARQNLSKPELEGLFRDELGIYDNFTINISADFPGVIDDFVEFAPHRHFQKMVTDASMFGMHTYLEAAGKDGLMQFFPFILLDKTSGIAYGPQKTEAQQDSRGPVIRRDLFFSAEEQERMREEERRKNQAIYREQTGKDAINYTCSVIFHAGNWRTLEAYYGNIARDALLFLRFVQERKLPAVLIDSYGWVHEDQKRERTVVYDPK